jgi:hypothetical protein
LNGPKPVSAPPSADARARRAFFRIGAASSLLVTAVLLIASLVRNDGHLLYVIDDAGIHLSLAHQLAAHATWGPFPGHYASASSSPGWTLLLAGLSLGHTGVLQILPVALNVTAGLWIIWLFARHQDYLLPGERRWAGYVLVAVLPVVLWFLPALAMVGMEHTLHAALVVQALVLFARLQTGRLTPRRCWPFLAVVALGSLVRYETAFVAAGCAVGIVLATTSRFADEATRTGRRLRESLGLAALTTAAAALPITIFGLVNRAFGEGFLPNSVTAKALVGKGAPLVPSIDHTMRALQQDAMVLVPALAVAAYLIWAWFGGPRANVALATAFLVAALLHASYANFHYFERYQAYLVIAGSFVLLRLAPEVVPRARKPAAIAFGLVVVVLLSTTRINDTHDAPLAMSNTYRQRYQLARFFATYYKGRAIGTGELGYPSLLHEGPIIDPLGLGTHAFLVERLRHHDVVGAAFVEAYFRRHDVQAVAIYPGNALGFELPRSWSLVGEWHLDERNVSGFEKVLAFYARDERQARELDRNLRAFAHRLPSDVSTVDRSAIVDRFLRGLHP